MRSTATADVHEELTRWPPTKAAGDRASLDGQAKAAAGRAHGEAVMALGEASYGYGDYAKAAEMFRAAQGKSGVDAELANLRLGMALAASGDKAGATAALDLVTGPRAEIARYWLTYRRDAPLSRARSVKRGGAGASRRPFSFARARQRARRATTGRLTAAPVPRRVRGRQTGSLFTRGEPGLRFDDRLQTLLDAPVADSRDRAVRWRQLVDLLSRLEPAKRAAASTRALDLVRARRLRDRRRGARGDPARDRRAPPRPPLLHILAAQPVRIAAPLFAGLR